MLESNTLHELLLLAYENIALNKPSRLSNAYSSTFSAARAFNGIFDSSNDMAHSIRGEINWLTVDLEKDISIVRMKIFNRIGYRRYIQNNLVLNNLASYIKQFFYRRAA